jgi:hypothetical protein
MMACQNIVLYQSVQCAQCAQCARMPEHPAVPEYTVRTVCTVCTWSAQCAHDVIYVHIVRTFDAKTIECATQCILFNANNVFREHLYKIWQNHYEYSSACWGIPPQRSSSVLLTSKAKSWPRIDSRACFRFQVFQDDHTLLGEARECQL